MKEYTYNSDIDRLIFLYNFNLFLPILGATSSFTTFKIPHKVYGTSVPHSARTFWRGQATDDFQVSSLPFCLNIFTPGSGFWLNPRGTDTSQHLGLIRLCAPSPWPKGYYSTPQSVFLRTLDCSKVLLEKTRVQWSKMFIETEVLK